MIFEERYDDAMFDFSTGEFDCAITKLKAILAEVPDHFDAQLSLGVAHYRKGDFATAIAEGHKAEQLKPKEQLVHTNLSLFYMKSGDKTRAEHHGLGALVFEGVLQCRHRRFDAGRGCRTHIGDCPSNTSRALSARPCVICA